MSTRLLVAYLNCFTELPEDIRNGPLNMSLKSGVLDGKGRKRDLKKIKILGYQFYVYFFHHFKKTSNKRIFMRNKKISHPCFS